MVHARALQFAHATHKLAHDMSVATDAHPQVTNGNFTPAIACCFEPSNATIFKPTSTIFAATSTPYLHAQMYTAVAVDWNLESNARQLSCVCTDAMQAVRIAQSLVHPLVLPQRTRLAAGGGAAHRVGIQNVLSLRAARCHPARARDHLGCSRSGGRSANAAHARRLEQTRPSPWIQHLRATSHRGQAPASRPPHLRPICLHHVKCECARRSQGRAGP